MKKFYTLVLQNFQTKNKNCENKLFCNNFNLISQNFFLNFRIIHLIKVLTETNRILNFKLKAFTIITKIMDQENNNVQQEEHFAHDLAFVVDIDGTLVISHKQIPGSTEALNYLTDNNIPYILLTNNISKSEQTKADELNSLMPNLKQPIGGNQVILNITPLKKYMNWIQKTILIVIRENEAKDRLPFDQIPFYITIDEYCTIFPESVPLSRRKFDEQAQLVKERVQKRLKCENITKESLKIGAVLVLNCPNRWEECYQVIIDLLSSEDGSIHQLQEYKYEKNHIPILTALNDLFYRTKNHPLPRILIKPFNEGLKSVYREIYGKQLNILTFGKPQKNTYDFAKQFIEKKYGKVKNIVMVGDNEATDIIGAHKVGWESILVKIGVTKHDSQYATHNCETLIEGFKKYIEKKEEGKLQ